MSDISKVLKESGFKPPPKPRTGSLWEGPESDGPNGGITFSALNLFLQCRERFRIRMVKGIHPVEEWSHRLFYGNLWHLAEECFAAKPMTRSPTWEHAILDYAKKESRKFPVQGQQIDHWYNVLKIQFPQYIDFWSKHKDTSSRTPLLQEQVFSGYPAG